MRKSLIFVASLFIIMLFVVAPALVYADKGLGKPRNTVKLTSAKNTHTKLINVQLGSVNGATFSVAKGGQNYTINTDNKTDFRRRYWGKSNLSEMSSGDKLNISGKFTDETRNVVQANWVRDLSIMKRFGVFSGKITALNADNFVIVTNNRGSQTVMFDSNTKFVGKTNKVISYSALQQGDQVQVKGEWDKTLNQISQVSSVKDKSH